MNQVFVQFMSKYADRLLTREFLLILFTRTDGIIQRVDDVGMPLDEVPNGTILRSTGRGTANFVYVQDAGLYNIPVNNTDKDVPFDLYDEIELNRGDIANWLGPKGKSTIGRYILNYIMLASIFDNKIEYVNDVWKVGKIEDQIAKGLISKEFDMSQYDKYMNHGYFLGHFAELCVPTITRRSMTTDPRIQEKKKELLEKFKDQLDDPNVISMIEEELLKMDKEWLAGDDALGFHEGIGGKSFDVHRKKMLLTVGGIEAFDADGGSFNFVGNSLSEGWDKKDFPVIANDVRKGSYARGKETAKGGALTKFILRVFQDVKITADNCGTTKGIKGSFDETIMSSLLGRTIMVSGKEVLITEDTYKQYVNKPIVLRSPTYCQTKDGLCFTCCGENFRSLGVKAIGPMAVEVSSRFMMASMKAMHGTKLKVIDIDHNKYFV